MKNIYIFETIYIKNYKPVFLEEHLNRLIKSVKFLYKNKTIKIDYSIIQSKNYWNDLRNEIKRKIEQKTERNVFKLKEARLKLIFSNGKIIIKIRPYHRIEKTANVIVFNKIKVNSKSKLIYHKTSERRIYNLSQKYAKKNNFDYGLLMNTDNNITETDVANIFFVKGNEIFTPDEKSGLLKGIIREKIRTITKHEGINFIQKKINIKEIFSNDYESAFLTNSLIGIKYVEKINDIKLKTKNHLVERIKKEITFFKK